jgi:hypothetical protein
VSTDERARIEVGFVGGGTLVALVPAAGAEALEKGLRDAPDGVVELQAEDGTYQVSLRHVTYLKRFARESRVGFGHVA